VRSRFVASLWPGLLERPYLIALVMALKEARMTREMEKTFPIVFRGKTIGLIINSTVRG
jgi:hypothetical protein